MPQWVKNTSNDQLHVVQKLLQTQSWFASHISSLLSQDQQARVISLLPTEKFLPGTVPLLLNAQRKNHLDERGFVLTTCRARSSRALPVYLFTNHAHYVINRKSTVFGKEQNHGG